MARNSLNPDPAHDVTGNGKLSHYDLACQLEMRGYMIRIDTDDNEHSYVEFDGTIVGDIYGDEAATVLTVQTDDEHQDELDELYGIEE